MKKEIICIVGPTACGKTEISIEIAKAIGGEIVSADSVQLYKMLNIGSAKPSKDEMQGIKHHLIDEIPIESPLTVAKYQQMAFECFEDILERGKKIIAVGGTGLYINALTTFMEFTEASIDNAFRDEWAKKELLQKGCAHQELLKIDPEAAKRLHENDQKRVIRALEIFHLTGKTLTEQSVEDSKKEPKYNSKLIGLTMPRALLYEKIEKRVDLMVENGLFDEVQGILDKGYDSSLMSLQGIGYKESISYLKGEISKQEAIDKIKLESRHLAKRQWTWFNRDKRIKWIDMTELKQKIIDDIIEYLENGVQSLD